MARWKTIAIWVAGGFTVLLVVLVLGVVALLHSERFHGYLLRTAQQKASEAFGSQVQMNDFAIHWSGISPMVDLYGVVVHGAAPYPNPPLLQATRFIWKSPSLLYFTRLGTSMMSASTIR